MPYNWNALSSFAENDIGKDLSPENSKDSELEEQLQNDIDESSSKTKEKEVKEYSMTDWIIKPIINTETICVEGKKRFVITVSYT